MNELAVQATQTDHRVSTSDRLYSGVVSDACFFIWVVPDLCCPELAEGSPRVSVAYVIPGFFNKKTKLMCCLHGNSSALGLTFSEL